MADEGGHEDALFGLNPLTIFANATDGAGGGDDSGGGRCGVGGVVEDVLEDVAEIAATDGIESQGVGVAVDGDPVDLVVVVEEIGDGLGTVPTDEKLLDHLAFGMMADDAFAGVAFEAAMGVEEFRRASGAKIMFRLADVGDARTGLIP
ncbi:MAG TPA: hypothetical protein VGT03_15970 [Candidatus Acidoferrales bacterium]|nr:hypothetical protein [Candidatus Acidoferrales bacterium]